MLVVFSLIFVAGVSTAPVYPPSCNKNVTLVDHFTQQPFNLAANFKCLWRFAVPSGSYAEIQLQASQTQYDDTIYIGGIDQIDGVRMNCPPERICDYYNVSTVYPGNFEILISTENSTQLKNVQFNISLQKVQKSVIGTHATTTNAQPNLIYFEDWREGTSYTFTSADSSVYIKQALDTFDRKHLDIELNKIFIYTENSSPVTMYDYKPTNATKITLYLSRKINIVGAVFVTDASNLDGIYDHHVQYVPLKSSSGTDFPPLYANGFYNPPWWGGVTVIGEKDGSTPIDVRQLSTFGGDGNFFYAPGGPIANHTNAIPFGDKQLPLHLTGNMNTFYIDKQQGNVKYTIAV